MSRQGSKTKFGGPSGSGAGVTYTYKKNPRGKPPASEKKDRLKIPAISVRPKTPPVNPYLERLKKKTIRRNPPANEDIKKIREVVKGLRNEPVTVQEFVALVSPYTGDHGQVLHSVMGEDLASFRKMAKRVYDTLTQDVSDVLANEQINLVEHYKERHTVYQDKMMRVIGEIHQYAPNFDFDQYFENTDAYLLQLFPIETELELDPEEEEMQRRQAAYHRLHWLRSEGIRLNEENASLQARLKQLKQQQKEELRAIREQEEMVDMKKNELEAEQTDLQNQLEDLNSSIGQSIMYTEEQMRVTGDAEVKKRASRKQVRPPVRSSSRMQPREPWSVKTAKKIEEENLATASKSATSGVSLASAQAKAAARKKPKPRSSKPAARPRDASPFHFSPVKSPPKPKERERSPFHYSPLKSPPPEAGRLEPVAAPVEQAPQTARLPTARRNRAPADTWTGFG